MGHESSKTLQGDRTKLNKTNKNLATANTSRVSAAHRIRRVHLGLITQ